MKQYLDILRHIRTNGVLKADRTGTGTYSVFGAQARFNLQDGFPLLTTKKLHIKSILHELLWFLKGETNTRYLEENGVTIWREWQSPEGELGPIYGKQWRSWAAPDGQTIDQIMNVVERIKTNPDCRRLIVSAWNVADLPKMALAPCHCLFQFYTSPASEKEKDELGVERRLSLLLFQRSNDFFLGNCYNFASYSFLLEMVAQCVGMVPHEFVWTGGDVHLYTNHVNQADLQLTREPRPLPRLVLNKEIKNIFDFKFEDFKIEGYNPHPSIAAPISV